jgi:bifunctional non-homologous end joining protein LigD
MAPRATKATKAKATKATKATKASKTTRTPRKAGAATDAPSPTPPQPGDAKRTVVEIDGHELTLSNLDKVLYPGSGFTKGDVIDYYVRIAPALLPHLTDRPLTMRRFPDGVDGQSFYAKHLPRGTPSWIRHAAMPRSPGSKDPSTVEFVILGDLGSLVWAANLASLEIHVPQWRIGPDDRPRPPDLMVFDLDPGPPATIVECSRVALILADVLRATRGSSAYPKTSGSKGMQVYLPLPPEARSETWEAGRPREEAKVLAEELAAEHPELIVSNMSKEIRAGRVLIDWSQNHVAKTTIAPYSLRARPDPTVSTPLTWEEVARCAEGGDGAAEALRFLPEAVLGRVEGFGDLFEPLEDDDD